MGLKKSIVLLALLMSLPTLVQAAILANIGEKAINDDQVRKEYDSITSEQKKAINADAITRRNMVDSMVNAEVLFLAAKKAGMENDEDYKTALERFQRQFLASKFMQKALEPKLSNSEVKKFFESNKNFFDSTQVCAHHIVLENESDAKKVLEEAKKKGAKFEDLAKKHSLDPTVQENKGNLGCFTRDRMVPEFAEAAFATAKKDFKGPVRTMYGYHIIRVDDIKPGKVPGFAEVEQRAKEALRLKLVTELITDLRTKSNVKVNDEAIKKFRL
ncbi:MAG: peptidylprolyl isomerase [Bdellovibrionota bacterium]